MLHLPTPMLMGAPQGKTYADYEAWALAQVAQDLGWPSGTGTSSTALWRVLLGGIFSGNMYGSPWGRTVSTDSAANRIALHSFLTQAEATANLGRYVLIGTQSAGFSVFDGLNRNGYPSLTYTETTEAAFHVVRFDYFDDASGKIRRVNPLANTFADIDLP